MAALRSSLRTLSRGSSVVSSAAAHAHAHMGGRGMELNRVLHRAAPPVHTAAIPNVEGCRRFSTEFGESADKAGSGKRTWWQRVKYHIESDDLVKRRRIHFVYTVFVLGTPTALFIRGFLQ